MQWNALVRREPRGARIGNTMAKEQHMRDPGMLLSFSQFLLKRATWQDVKRYSDDDLEELRIATYILEHAAYVIREKVHAEYHIRDDRKDWWKNKIPSGIGADGRVVYDAVAPGDSRTDQDDKSE